jgi:phosphopantothenate-cysteine ligase
VRQLNSISIEQLETDESLLIPKAQKALTRYGHQAVVANELHKRKHEVCLVEMTTASEQNASPKFTETWLRLEQLTARQGGNQNSASIHQPEIEQLIIEELLQRHEEWLRGQ